MRKRIQWVDTARFLGIFAIYLGHTAQLAGKSYDFVFHFHVALFFLISGAMSNYDKDSSIISFIKKQFKNIMVPFFGFSLLSIILYMLISNEELQSLSSFVITVLKGNIRNTFFAQGLWFLSCLFLIEIIFKVLRKLDNRLLIFLFCLIMFVIAEAFIYPHPLINPHWLYNLDSAFYYIIFYAIGYIIYPWILDLFKFDNRGKKIFFVGLGSISFLYALLIFFGRDYLTRFVTMIPVVRILCPIFKSCLLIWFILTLAKMLESVNLFREIGTNTLYLCCNEFIIKYFTTTVLEIVGGNLTLNTPFHAYVYTMILLVFAVKYFIPIEKRIIGVIQTGIKEIFSEKIKE